MPSNRVVPPGTVREHSKEWYDWWIKNSPPIWRDYLLIDGLGIDKTLLSQLKLRAAALLSNEFKQTNKTRILAWQTQDQRIQTLEDEYSEILKALRPAVTDAFRRNCWKALVLRADKLKLLRGTIRQGDSNPYNEESSAALSVSVTRQLASSSAIAAPPSSSLAPVLAKLPKRVPDPVQTHNPETRDNRTLNPQRANTMVEVLDETEEKIHRILVENDLEYGDVLRTLGKLIGRRSLGMPDTGYSALIATHSPIEPSAEMSRTVPPHFGERRNISKTKVNGLTESVPPNRRSSPKGIKVEVELDDGLGKPRLW